MKTIRYEKELVKFDGHAEAIDVYFFYIDGLWDGDKILYEEAAMVVKGVRYERNNKGTA